MSLEKHAISIIENKVQELYTNSVQLEQNILGLDFEYENETLYVDILAVHFEPVHYNKNIHDQLYLGYSVFELECDLVGIVFANIVNEKEEVVKEFNNYKIYM